MNFSSGCVWFACGTSRRTGSSSCRLWSGTGRDAIGTDATQHVSGRSEGLPQQRIPAPGQIARSALAKLSEAIARTLADAASTKRPSDTGASVPKQERQGGAYMDKFV